MHDEKGFIKIAYVIALLLLGIVIWGFFQSRASDMTKHSVALDNDLTDTLAAAGFSNADILAQSREERSLGAGIWIEYYKEAKLPRGLTLPALKEKLQAVALKHKCELKERGTGDFELLCGNKLFSRFVIKAVKAKRTSGKPKLAVVIDDVGNNYALEKFLNIGIPITFAILPHEPFSKKAAAELSRRGMPYILHLPLEPVQYPKINPGKAALLTGMTRAEIVRKFESNLASVPGVSGVSNHMGSRFSSDPGKMRILLGLVKDKGLFYFDSYTSSSTKASIISGEIGLPYSENGIFVDLEDDGEFMKNKLALALKKAEKHGSCAVIGHVQKKALPEALKSAAADFKARGVEFVYLADILKEPEGR